MFVFNCTLLKDDDEEDECKNCCDLSGSAEERGLIDSSRLALSGRDSKLTESGGVGGADKPREGDTDDDDDTDTDLEAVAAVVVVCCGGW